MNLNIRLATMADIVAIMTLRNETATLLKERQIDQWQHREPSQTTFIKDIQQQDLFVYEINNKIVGMIAIKLGIEPTYNLIYDGKWRYEGPYITIHRLAVKRSFLGKNIASELLAFAHAEAIKKQVYVMRIDTHRDNRYAQKLFLNHGYQEVGYILLEKDDLGDRHRLAFDCLLQGGKT
ncbi:MAG: GNAT family N-acetyltransferase [Acholeplasmataceae bacterium]|nr:GNAT family N-acetyltransferase [Acholeplasmataceae bacterium]